MKEVRARACRRVAGRKGGGGRKGCNLIGVFYCCGDRGHQWFGKVGGVESSEESQGGPSRSRQNVFGDAPEASSTRQHQGHPPPRRRLTGHSGITATAEECLSASNAWQNQGRRIA